MFKFYQWLGALAPRPCKSGYPLGKAPDPYHNE